MRKVFLLIAVVCAVGAKAQDKFITLTNGAELKGVEVETYDNVVTLTERSGRVNIIPYAKIQSAYFKRYSQRFDTAKTYNSVDSFGRTLYADKDAHSVVNAIGISGDVERGFKLGKNYELFDKYQVQIDYQRYHLKQAGNCGIASLLLMIVGGGVGGAVAATVSPVVGGVVVGVVGGAGAIMLFPTFAHLIKAGKQTTFKQF